jgi:hypothetical protein
MCCCSSACVCSAYIWSCPSIPMINCHLLHRFRKHPVAENQTSCALHRGLQLQQHTPRLEHLQHSSLMVPLPTAEHAATPAAPVTHSYLLSQPGPEQPHPPHPPHTGVARSSVYQLSHHLDPGQPKHWPLPFWGSYLPQPQHNSTQHHCAS